MTRKMNRWIGSLAAAVVAMGASLASAQPALDEDLGALTSGVTVVRQGRVAANVPPHWYRFTIPTVPVASGAGHAYLDIRTTNPSSNTSFISSSIGLYDAAGNLATGSASSSVDRTEGPGVIAGFTTGGALSYGATCPTRANNATPPATINGTLFNGRDGGLPAGTYYLAFMRDGGTYGSSNWSVTPVTVGTVDGTVQVEITLGMTGNPPPVLTGSGASPAAVNSGGATLLTVTAGSCTTGDVPTSMTIDLSSVGGGSAAPMYNDGTHGDAGAGDNIWSLMTTVIASPGTYQLPATGTNIFGVSATRNVPVIINGASAPVLISQINGTGATQHSWSGPTANYVEVHNTSAGVVDLSGWAVQATTSTGTAWVVRPFQTGFTIPAHGYALVQFGNASVPLNSPNNPDDVAGFVPDADVVGAGGSLSSSGGKIALTRSQLALSGACPSGDPSVVDFVGYGAADCSLGSPAPGLSNFDGRAIYRGCSGSANSGNNAADFSLDLSSPRSRAFPANTGAMTAVGAPAPTAVVSVVQDSSVLLTATAASCAGVPTGVQFTADLSYVGGPAAAAMYDDGTHGDAAAHDGVFSLSYTVPSTLLPAPPPGPAINRPYIVPMIGTDALGRTAHAYAAFYVTAAPTGACCAGGQVSVRTAAWCAAAGGTYLGDHSSPFGAAGPTYPGAPVVGIPSPGTATDSIVVTDQIPIERLVVHLQCDHTYLGDLRCTLAKGTTTVTLFDHVGVAGNNATGRPGNFDGATTYTFMDGGASFWNAAYNGGKDTNYYEPGGYYAPSGAANAPSLLAPFVGSSSEGTWTLTMLDWVATDSGSFHWSIEFNPTPACTGTCAADFDCDGDVGTDADIESFFACLAGSCPSAPCMSTADFNGDGDVGTDADIEAFFRVLAGGAC
jgi:hypothetical protein